MLSHTPEDVDLVGAINRSIGARLTIRGRALAGELGGAIFVEWPDGHSGVVTVFHGGVSDAQRVARVMNDLQARGLPLPRHERVVDLGDRVVFLQQRLGAGPHRQLTPERVDEIAAINERFADALVDFPDVPPMAEWFQRVGGDSRHLVDLIPRGHQRAADVVNEIVRVITRAPGDVLAGQDLVHVDLSAANVLFDDQGRAVAVVDWNLGVYRGPRQLALVQTRFDREWFLRRPAVSETEVAAVRRLDELLIDHIHPDTLRAYWAYWLGHHLLTAFRSGVPAVIDWQLELAESRLR